MSKVGYLTIEMDGEPAKTFTIGEGSLTPEKLVEFSMVTDQNGVETQRLNLTQAKSFLKGVDTDAFVSGKSGGQANGCQLIVTEE